MECCDFPNGSGAMTTAALISLEKLTVPLGGQQIELQQIEFVPGSMPLLRVRIREGKRFTVFDIDPQTAERWGRTMTAWAAAQTTAGK
jgi:hypothetical protein